eukprot:tig00021290_g19977.t1
MARPGRPPSRTPRSLLPPRLTPAASAFARAQERHHYKSTQEGDDYMVIDDSDPEFRATPLFIAVHGAGTSPARFELAVRSNSTFPLSLGR